MATENEPSFAEVRVRLTPSMQIDPLSKYINPCAGGYCVNVSLYKVPVHSCSRLH